MAPFFFIDYLVSFFILLAIHAPWWAWVIYVVSAVFWFVIWALSDGETNEKTADAPKQE